MMTPRDGNADGPQDGEPHSSSASNDEMALNKATAAVSEDTTDNSATEEAAPPHHAAEDGTGASEPAGAKEHSDHPETNVPPLSEVKTERKRVTENGGIIHYEDSHYIIFSEGKEFEFEEAEEDENENLTRRQRKAREGNLKKAREKAQKRAQRDIGMVKYFTTESDTDKLAIVSELADEEIALRSVLYSIGRHDHPNYFSMISRGNQYTAYALKLAFEGNKESANSILRTYTNILTTRNDSFNRLKFVWANLYSLAAIILLWLVLRTTGAFIDNFESQSLQEWFSLFDPVIVVSNSDLSFLEPNTPVEAHRFHALDVLVLGAIGAFFSVQSRVEKLSIRHSITLSEMVYTGFVRVPIGLIAAGVVILLVGGSWILGGLEDVTLVSSIYLMGFLAGFSEQFVPNALGDIESQSAPQKQSASSLPKIKMDKS